MNMLTLHLCLNRNKQSEVLKSNCISLQIKMKKMRGHSSRSLRGGENMGDNCSRGVIEVNKTLKTMEVVKENGKKAYNKNLETKKF